MACFLSGVLHEHARGPSLGQPVVHGSEESFHSQSAMSREAPIRSSLQLLAAGELAFSQEAEAVSDSVGATLAFC